MRELLQALQDTESKPHLDGVRKRVRFNPRLGLAALQRELAQEIASSLGRAARRIEDALERLKSLDRDIEAAGRAGHSLRVAELVGEFNDERQRALRFVRDLTIQREALGFRRHDELKVKYPVPDAKSAR